MIVIILSVVLFLIFSVLSTFHVYWLFGGLWGGAMVMPTKTDSDAVFSPPKLATLVVAIGLFLFGVLYLVVVFKFDVPLPDWMLNAAYWFVPSIFILRSIGEFRYVGFFKKVKNTKFAKADTKIFAPLCLVIGIMGILVQLLQ